MVYDRSGKQVTVASSNDYLVEEVDADDDGSRAVTDIERQNSEWLRKCKNLV